MVKYYTASQSLYLKQLGERIRAFRLLRGYSQEGMALNMKMDRSYFGRVERGEINISILKIKLIAEVLEIEPSILIDLKDNNTHKGGTNIGC